MRRTGKYVAATEILNQAFIAKRPANQPPPICEDILMRCDVNSIFDCAGVLICTPSNQIIEVYKQVAK